MYICVYVVQCVFLHLYACAHFFSSEPCVLLLVLDQMPPEGSAQIDENLSSALNT